jgi:hypothetical protein
LNKKNELRNLLNQSFFALIMSDSTSIFDLPTDPASDNNQPSGNNNQPSGNNNQQQQQNNNSQSSIALDPTTISQIVSGLQQASLTGATQLPSRDIPMNTMGHSNDPQTQPNYVPPPPQNNMDYIENENYESTSVKTNSLDNMYDEIQTPLLLAILYFLFQLPFFRKFLFGYFPILFSNDGNLNINGFLFTSSLFGILYYFLNKTTNYFGAF